jgi:hypothetical protein
VTSRKMSDNSCTSHPDRGAPAWISS